MSCWTQNSREMELAPYLWKINTMPPYHIVEYGYGCPIEPLIYIFWVNIGWYMLIYISYCSDSVSWWTQNSKKVSSFINTNNYHNYPSFLIKGVYLGHIEPLVYFMGEYWFRYTNSIPRFSYLLSWWSQNSKKSL